MNKILGKMSIVVLVAILTTVLFTMGVSATETPQVVESLTFSDSTADVNDQEGYSWDNATNTLTIKESGLIADHITLYCDSKIIVNGPFTINNTGTTSAILSDSNLEIENNSKVTINPNVNHNMTDIHTLGNMILGGTGTINCAHIRADGSMDINDTVTLNVTKFIRGLDVDIEETTNINSIVYSGEFNNADVTIMGDFICDNTVIDQANSLSFAEGSKITIPEQKQLSLHGLDPDKIDFTNATIDNKNILRLPLGADVKEINFISSSIITINSIYVDTNGNPIGDISVDYSKEETNWIYSWTKDENDVWTLELFVDEIKGDVVAVAKDIVIKLTKDFTADEVTACYNENGNNLPANVLLTGDYTLNTTGYAFGFIGNLTIDEGTTLNAKEAVGSLTYSVGGIQNFTANLTVNGNLKASLIQIGNLTVGNTGTVDLTYDVIDESNMIFPTSFFAMSLTDEVPTVTLGDKLTILEPRGAVFKTEQVKLNSTDTYLGIFVSNNAPVKELKIGLAPYWDIDVTKTGNGEVTATEGTITDGTITLKDGANQEFTFAPSKGYEISDVKVDGESVGKVTSYKFEDIAKSHTLEVIFKEIIVTPAPGASTAPGTTPAPGTTTVPSSTPVPGTTATPNTTPAPSTSTTPDASTDSPDTGDNGNMAVIISMMFALTGILVIYRKKFVK